MKNKKIWNIPNLITCLRIMAIPFVVLCFYAGGRLETLDKSSDFTRWTAFTIFFIAAASDFLDGYFARAWKQSSEFGKMLDPIADKLLVAICLLLLAAEGTLAGWSTWAAMIILSREILVSGLREYLAQLKVSVPVTRLAKWKTTLQIAAISFLLIGPAGEKFFAHTLTIGHFLLWGAAVVTLYTGYDYCRAGWKHMTQQEK